jgi:hypothetical protein
MDGALVATGSVWLSQLVCEIVDRLWVYPHPVNLLLSPSGSQWTRTHRCTMKDGW